MSDTESVLIKKSILHNPDLLVRNAFEQSRLSVSEPQIREQAKHLQERSNREFQRHLEVIFSAGGLTADGSGDDAFLAQMAHLQLLAAAVNIDQVAHLVAELDRIADPERH